MQVSEPGLKPGVDQLIAAPPSLEGRIALGSLSTFNLADADAMSQLEHQFGHSHGPAGKAAYRIFRELRIRGTEGYETGQLPRINERLVEVKPVVIDELKPSFPGIRRISMKDAPWRNATGGS